MISKVFVPITMQSQYVNFSLQHSVQAILFLYSVNLTEYVAMDPRVSVCVSVCLCVCLCHLYSPNEWTDFDETFHKSPTMNLRGPFFSYFENSKRPPWRHQIWTFKNRKIHHKQISLRSFVQSFIRIDTTVLAVELPHTHRRTHIHTHTHTLIHTPSVSIATYSVKMTEYKNL